MEKSLQQKHFTLQSTLGQEHGPAPELMHIWGREKLKSESLFKGITVYQADN